ncbi:MAG TPA: amidohydrolase family protein [Thermoanaerobaculia bacterium]|nr:amidohydrolase family protein [Thermoanaerobaculia bacterium]
MRATTLLFLTLILTGCAASDTVPPAPAAERDDAYAIVGATVIPMNRPGSLENQTILVEGERIVAAGPAGRVTVPPGTAVIEGRGRFVIPGLAEMHGHVPPPNAPADHVEDVLFLYVASGVTTVRGMLGAPGQLALKERTASGELVGPNLYLAGPSFNGQSVNSPEEAIAKVRQQHAEGWDLIKIHPGLTRPEYDAMARTAREVGMRFGGHVPQEVGLEHAIEMGQETFDHLDGYIEHLEGMDGPVDPGRLRAIVEKTRSAGAWVVPTMALWETLVGTADLATLTSYPELVYMPAGMVANWTEAHRNRLANRPLPEAAAKQMVANRIEILRALHEGGVRVLMGTDAPQQFSVPGFALHREFPRMLQAGMTPWEIIESGTRNVGIYFANEDRFGTIEPGQRADIVVLAADPLADIANLRKIEGVMVRGRWLDRAAIDRRLAEIAARRDGGQ